MMYPIAMFPSGAELWIIVVLILVLFGGKKIPELMRGVGKGVGELHKGLEEGRKAVEQSAEEEAAKAAAASEAAAAAEKGKGADGKN